MKRLFLNIVTLTTLLGAQTISAYAADPTNPNCTNSALGCIAVPSGLPVSTAPGGGLIILLTNSLRLVFVFGGIYMFIRIVIAGLHFMQSGGDPKQIQQATDSIWQSVLGLIIMVSAFIVAALMGLLFFGNAGAILNPTITGPGV